MKRRRVGDGGVEAALISMPVSGHIHDQIEASDVTLAPVVPVRVVLRDAVPKLFSAAWPQQRAQLLAWAKANKGEFRDFGAGRDRHTPIHRGSIETAPLLRQRVRLRYGDIEPLGAHGIYLPDLIVDTVIQVLYSYVKEEIKERVPFTEYRLMSAGILIDPIGSGTQLFHVDIISDRDPVWNMLIPLQVPPESEYKYTLEPDGWLHEIAQSPANQTQVPQCAGDE